MSAWRRAIPREPGVDTDSLGSGPVPAPINLEQPIGHRTPNVVAPTTIQEMSFDKGGAPRDIVKPHGLSEGPRRGGRYLQAASKDVLHTHRPINIMHITIITARPIRPSALVII